MVHYNNHFDQRAKRATKRFFRHNKVLVTFVVFVLLIGAVSALTPVYSDVLRPLLFPSGSTAGSVYSNGTAGDRVISLINEDRVLDGAAGVYQSDSLSQVAYTEAVTYMNTGATGGFTPQHESVAVVSADDFGRDFYHSPETVMDVWRNTDLQFRRNEVNREYTTAGIGIVEGNGNYYIVVIFR